MNYPFYTSSYTFRWFRLNDLEILWTDDWHWNPDDPDIVDWFKL